MWWGECMCRLPTPGRLLLLLPDRVLLLPPDRVLLLLPDRVLLLVLCALVAPSAASGGRASDGERHCAGIWSDDVIYEVRHQGAGPPLGFRLASKKSGARQDGSKKGNCIFL